MGFVKVMRQTISWVGNDIVGEASLLTGYKCVNDGLVFIGAPLLVFSLWHIPHMFNRRRELDREVKKNRGLNKKIIDKYNHSSFCSSRVLRAHIFAQGKSKELFREFKELLNKYNYKHYAKQLVHNVKEAIDYCGNSFKKIFVHKK